jgi:hypothetical protein
MMAWLSLAISALTPCMLWTHQDPGIMVSHFPLFIIIITITIIIIIICALHIEACDVDIMCASTVSTEASS